MRTLSLVAFAVLASVGVVAQSPQLFSYQAVVRDAGNILVTQSPVGMRVSILQGSPNGPAVYVETHTPTTNANGLASVAVGGGTVVSGSMVAIDWSAGPYFIQTETDPAGGTAYSIVGTTQLLSVPYALHARKAEIDNVQDGDTTYWKSSGGAIYFTGQVGVGKVYQGGSTMDIGGSWVELASGTSGQAGLIKNIPQNVPGYDGTLMLGLAPYYSTVELHHQLGGYGGGPNFSNFFTTFNTTEGNVGGGERMRIAPNGNVGIGTTSPQRKLHVSDVLRLEPRSSAPTGPSKGDIYFDNTLNKLRVYDGTTWQNCW